MRPKHNKSEKRSLIFSINFFSSRKELYHPEAQRGPESHHLKQRPHENFERTTGLSEKLLSTNKKRCNSYYKVILKAYSNLMHVKTLTNNLMSSSKISFILELRSLISNFFITRSLIAELPNLFITTML